MKILLATIFTSIFSMNTFAGDLNVTCFVDMDPGNYIETTGPFMQRDSISLRFNRDQYDYVVLVSRESLFEKYSYQVIRIDLNDQSYQSGNYTVSKYDEIIRIDENLYCQTSD